MPLCLFYSISVAAYLNDSTGNMSDYINTSLHTPHTHYDTDFPELTSKLEKFSLGAQDSNTNALFWNVPTSFDIWNSRPLSDARASYWSEQWFVKLVQC